MALNRGHNSTRRPSPERGKQSEIWGGRGKKKARNVGPPALWAQTLWGQPCGATTSHTPSTLPASTLSGFWASAFLPHLSGPTLDWPRSDLRWPKSAQQIFEIFAVKSGPQTLPSKLDSKNPSGDTRGGLGGLALPSLPSKKTWERGQKKTKNRCGQLARCWPHSWVDKCIEQLKKGRPQNSSVEKKSSTYWEGSQDGRKSLWGKNQTPF